MDVGQAAAVVSPIWASAGAAALIIGSAGIAHTRGWFGASALEATKGEEDEWRLERRRKRLYAVARGLLATAHPLNIVDAERQIRRCNKAARKTLQLQWDIQELIKDSRASEGRLRAAAVAALTESLLRLREGIAQLHLDYFTFLDTPDLLVDILQRGTSKDLLDGATKAIGIARRYVVEISPRRIRLKRVFRLILVALYLRPRAVDEIGASDLERSCDEAEQMVESLAIGIEDDINQLYGNAFEILSTCSDDSVLGQIRIIVSSSITGKAKPQDHCHPALRIRLLEMLNKLAGMPADWFNLRWMALLYGLIGWVELFAAYHYKAASNLEKAASNLDNAASNLDKALERVQQARNFYHAGRRLSLDSSVHRRWSVRLQKFVGNSGIVRKRLSWANPPTRSEIDDNLKGLIKAISEFINSLRISI